MDEVRQAISKGLEVDKSLVAVKSIDTSFGHNHAKVTACQYYSQDEMARIEKKNKKPKAEAPKAEKEKK